MQKTTVLLAALAATATAHMEMKFPPPFNSKYNPYNDWSNIDYSMTSPLLQDGSNYPCKGYHSLLGTPAGRPTTSFEVGSAASINVVGGAIHGGGSCQVSLSTDGARTFTVLKSIIGNCPAGFDGDIGFTVPADAPAGEAVLAWSWHNRIGNREMYMNCAAVTLTRGGGVRPEQVGGAAQGVSYWSQPRIFVANVANGCSVAEGGDVVYPDPGMDVVHQSTNPIEPAGECGSSSPPSSPPPSLPPPSSKGGKGGDKGRKTGKTRKGHKGRQGRKGHKGRKGNKNSPNPAAVAAPQRPAAAATTTTTTLAKANTGPPRSGSGPEQRPEQRPEQLHPGPVSSAPSGANWAPGSSCADEGLWDCLPGGVSWQRCASGQWSVVMPMPAGTVCAPGLTNNLVLIAAR
ncbi:hypothetical protein VMCG_07517 [Cytospora schulzeri]|uniref:Lytic polysaccharide monooxygenase n=1 Tax=Cytospora schulzeri TaxID=448051 RepID=A0A423W1F6_9PEZI|nr:hypothetical protein VMCG_07517 [Valsa malicola]